MRRGGYVKVYRSLADDPLWTHGPFTRGQAWVDLMMLANYKPGHLRVRGKRTPLQRGQVGWSISRLAARWVWSKGRVVRFLDELEMERQIEQSKDGVSCVVTITNYERYQGNGTMDGTQTGHKRNADGTQTEHNKEGKKGRTPSPPTPASVNPSAPTPEPLSAEWQAVVAEMKKARVGLAEWACESARSRECLPSEAMHIVNHFNAHPGAWQPGFLKWLIENLRPDSKVDWPEPSAEYLREQEQAKRVVQVEKQVAKRTDRKALIENPPTVSLLEQLKLATTALPSSSRSDPLSISEVQSGD